MLLLLQSAASGAQGLTPSLFTNTNTFYSPTVGRGAVGLTPDLFTNSQTFYAPTVSTTYGLTPSLFTNTNTFYTPTVAAGAVTLTPSLFTNDNTFYSPTVDLATFPQDIAPPLFANDNTFYQHVLTGGAVSTGGGWLDPEQVKRLERLAKEAERTRQKQWAKAQAKRAERLEELRETYDRVNGIATPEERVVLQAAVAPFVKTDSPAKPVDWGRLTGTAEAVAQVARALERVSRERQEAVDMADLEYLMAIAA